MDEPLPPTDPNSENTKSPAQAPNDYYSVLTKVIDDVTNDRALLRKLVFALAWQNLHPEAIIGRPIQQAQQQAKSIFELPQALELERAMDRIEAEAAGGSPRQISTTPPIAETARPTEPRSSESDAAPDQFNLVAAVEDIWLTDHPYTVVSTPDDAFVASTIEPAAMVEQIPLTDHPSEPLVTSADAAFVGNTIRPAVMVEQIPLTDHPPEPLHPGGQIANAFAPSNNTQSILPSDQRAWDRIDVVSLERIPAWLDPRDRVSLDAGEYAPIHLPHQPRTNFVSFLQMIAASMIGVILYVGISGWMFMGRQSTPPAVPHEPASQTATIISALQEVERQRKTLQPPAPPEAQSSKPLLPFPLPRTYGVYAATAGQLKELEPLPIKIPDARIVASAEIRKAGPPPMSGENLAFIIFRREIINNAPEKATVRVVAQVTRSTKFINNKPGVVQLEDIWRIRNKFYEFKVSPVEGRNEMVLIQPNSDFVFPPGRYALVLNGIGYDFAILGSVTSPEHCLEQVEAVNGVMLNECPKG